MWSCHRLVNDKLVTWTEVTTTMSIDDVDLLCISADLIFDTMNQEVPKP